MRLALRYRQATRDFHRRAGAKQYQHSAGAASLRSSQQSLRDHPPNALPLVLPKISEEETAEVKKVVGDAAFLLVTSANHMTPPEAFFDAPGLPPIRHQPNQLAVTAAAAAEKSIPSRVLSIRTVSRSGSYEGLGRLWQSVKIVR